MNKCSKVNGNGSNTLDTNTGKGRKKGQEGVKHYLHLCDARGEERLCLLRGRSVRELAPDFPASVVARVCVRMCAKEEEAIGAAGRGGGEGGKGGGRGGVVGGRGGEGEWER